MYDKSTLSCVLGGIVKSFTTVERSDDEWEEQYNERLGLLLFLFYDAIVSPYRASNGKNAIGSMQKRHRARWCHCKFCFAFDSIATTTATRRRWRAPCPWSGDFVPRRTNE
jgi:hypothetical protein